MITFALISTPNADELERRTKFVREWGGCLVPYRALRPVTWSPRAGKFPFAIVAWPAVPIPDDPDVLEISDEKFFLSMGWNKRSGIENTGEHVSICIDEFGNGFIKRNLTAIYHIYYSSWGRGAVCSNRASLAAAIKNESLDFNYDSVNLATCIGIGWPNFDRTMFSDVRCLTYGAEPILEYGRMTSASVSFDRWENEELSNQYKSDPDYFWDDRLAELAESVNIFFHDDLMPKFERFSISGGKDSRLLFAVMKRISGFDGTELLTHGAPTGQDVVVAAQIAQHYRMSHLVMDSVYQTLDLQKVLSEHLFLSEGTVSPHDFTIWRPFRGDGINVYGHELGLREPIPSASDGLESRALFSDVIRFFHDFDRVGLLTGDAREAVKNEALLLFNNIFESTSSPDNVLWRYYIENRVLHYVSHIKRKDESQRFSPYPLMTDKLVCAAYAIGRDARRDEMVHFELLRRLDEWLTFDCPFAAQSWPLSLRKKSGSLLRYARPIPAYYSKKVPPKGTYAAFMQNRNLIKEFIIDNMSFIRDIVDRVSVEKWFSKENIVGDEVQCVWYLFMFCGIRSANWKKMQPEGNFLKYSPYPALIYSNSTINNVTSKERSLADVYLGAVPEATYALARTEQARHLAADARHASDCGLKTDGAAMHAAAAVLGDANSIFHLGKMLFDGEIFQQNRPDGLQLLEEARRRGVAAASNLLARLYREGTEIPRDIDRAILLEEEAAARGDSWALLRLCSLKEEKGVSAQSEWGRLEAFLQDRVSRRDDAYAHFVLGTIYDEGKHGAIDKERATEAFRKSAAMGYDNAQRRLQRDEQRTKQIG